MVGMGIRLAQDVGAHRRKPWTPEWTVEDELKKRAFWLVYCIIFGDTYPDECNRVLVSHDRHVSSFIGRPRAMQDEECVSF